MPTANTKQMAAGDFMVLCVLNDGSYCVIFYNCNIFIIYKGVFRVMF